MASVLVPLAQGCEELEAVTVVDLLRRAGIGVVTAGLDDKPVRASRGVVLVPDTSLDEALKQQYDMVVLPGGLPGADNLDADARVRGLLKQMSETDRYTAAICACWMISRGSSTARMPWCRMAKSLPRVVREQRWISH